MTHKALLRRTVLQYRKLLAHPEYARRNERICQRLLNVVQHLDAHYIHLFLPIEQNNEPDVRPILAKIWGKSRRTMISKTDFATKTLTHHWFTASTALVNNHLGIPEPLHPDPADIQQADLILVPLLMADKHGHRIGYGGGFYDRLLRETQAHSVGLCLAPLVDKLPSEPWDAPVDQLLTPFD
jgi:5-formyltetrahydrofolate cyclo-ligase